MPESSVLFTHIAVLFTLLAAKMIGEWLGKNTVQITMMSSTDRFRLQIRQNNV